MLFLITTVLLWAHGLGAQPNDVVRGPHGGKLQEVLGLEVELSIGDSDVALCIYDTQKTPLDPRQYKASVDIVTGANRQQFTLQPEDSGSRLVGKSNAPLRPYSAVSLNVTTPAGATTNVAF